MTDRCSTCHMPTVWAGDRLICPRPACPGHTDLAASTKAAGAQLAADGGPAASTRASTTEHGGHKP